MDGKPAPRLTADPSHDSKRPDTPPHKCLVLAHVTVIDVAGGGAGEDMNVSIEGGRITALGRAGEGIPAGASVVDARGKFLIPGLWDMHVHLGEGEAALALNVANAITGVRDMGGRAEKLFRWRAGVAAGEMVGPRIVACGSVVDGPEPAHPEHAVAVRTAADGRRAVASLKRGGADFVKVYDGVPRPAFYAVADAARRWGIPFVGHVPRSVSMLEVSDAGAGSIEHLGTAVEESSAADAGDESPANGQQEDAASIPARMAARGRRTLDAYSDEKAARLFARLAENRTWQVPTLVVKRTHAWLDEISAADDPRTKYVPPAEMEWWLPHNYVLFRHRTPEWAAYRKRLFRKETEVVLAMHRAGVELLAGTDVGEPYLYHGSSLHDELALLVAAGLTPSEALRTATLNPARFLGVSDSLGTVERGKVADLALLDANPLEDIGNTRRIHAVVLNGRYFPSESLQAMLAGVAAARGREDV